MVDVKDGKVVRIRPLHYDSKYDSPASSWEMERNGVKSSRWSNIGAAPWGLAYKKGPIRPTACCIR
jgi:trimethylamine-N-oxide reductase (cytochrome c)